MSIQKLKLKSIVLNLLLVLPIVSFAAISQQDKDNFKNLYGSEIKPATYANILNSCDENDTDIDSCLKKLKAQPSEKKVAKNKMSYSYCCLNVSNAWGEYAYIHSQAYCIPPC